MIWNLRLGIPNVHIYFKNVPIYELLNKEETKNFLYPRNRLYKDRGYYIYNYLIQQIIVMIKEGGQDGRII